MVTSQSPITPDNFDAVKMARADRRTCVNATVTAPDGSPVSGARVTLGRKSKLTDESGRTRICRRFKKAGSPVLSATKDGFDAAPPAPGQATAVRRTPRSLRPGHRPQ